MIFAFPWPLYVSSDVELAAVAHYSVGPDLAAYGCEMAFAGQSPFYCSDDSSAGATIYLSAPTSPALVVTYANPHGWAKFLMAL